MVRSPPTRTLLTAPSHHLSGYDDDNEDVLGRFLPPGQYATYTLGL
jgi:hypothetical protein